MRAKAGPTVPPTSSGRSLSDAEVVAVSQGGELLGEARAAAPVVDLRRLVVVEPRADREAQREAARRTARRPTPPAWRAARALRSGPMAIIVARPMRSVTPAAAASAANGSIES